MRRRGRSSAALGAVLAALVAACGTTTTTPTASAAATAPPTSTATPTASPSAIASPTGGPVLAIVPVPTSRFATPPPAGKTLDAAVGVALQKTLDTLRASGGYPGVSAAIVAADGSTWSGQAGLAVISTKTPVTADTVFSIGSISKTFVSALAGRLAARGTISLDDPLSKYVPTFPNGANITLRELLNHTSGIRDIFDTGALNDAIVAQPSKAWTANQVLAAIGSPYSRPGAGYHYSNTNYVLMGLAIEKATGQPIGDLIRSEFLTPLGMDHTFYQVTEQTTDPKADGYWTPASAPVDRWPGQKMIPFVSEVTAAGPAGAYVSNAADLARWANALYNGDILDQATLASIVDISPLSKTFRFQYGLGFEETTVAGQLSWGHRGHLDGFWGAMEYLPASHLTIVVLTNAQWANDPAGLASVLAKIVLAPPN